MYRLLFRGRKGFTVAELLVVVAVLALLVSVVLVNLRGARESARIATVLSFQSQTHRLLGADLVGWWNFDERDSRDLSGYNNHGVITGTSIIDGVPGTRGSALRFNGSSDRVVMVATNNHLDFTHGEQFSYGAWFKAESFPNAWHGIISKKPSWGHGYGLQIGLTQNIACMTGGFYTRTVWRPETNVWYHAICSYDGTHTTLYVNGNRESSHNNNIQSGNTDLKLGMFYTTGSLPFHGLIDDVRIYSRALTAQEVENLYAQTKGKYLAWE